MSRRVPLCNTGDDPDRLATTLNHMPDRTTTPTKSLRQVSSDIADDLRMPLTRPFQRLENTRLHARSVTGYAAAAEAALGKTQEPLCRSLITRLDASAWRQYRRGMSATSCESLISLG
jgi:hypothetical protein